MQRVYEEALYNIGIALSYLKLLGWRAVRLFGFIQRTECKMRLIYISREEKNKAIKHLNCAGINFFALIRGVFMKTHLSPGELEAI